MRSKLINRYAKDIVKKLRGSLSEDYEKNKDIIRKMEPNLSKKQINELSGYVTKLVQKGE
ncbi:MAG: hypothetical protein PHF51_03980 [Candidatus ainarchaeum sp.]|nr:hypothetical protein [Candidatus ainarchaeum sp.]